MNSTLLSSIVLSVALILSAYLLSHSISDLATANHAPQQLMLTGNGQRIAVELAGRNGGNLEVNLGGHIGFSDCLNPLKIEQKSDK